MTPLVSVIIPTYYRNERLARCIESVLSQTHDNIEIIVVDDSGESHAKSVVSPYEAEYLALESNNGQNAARNRGFEVAEGSYIQFLDDDDILLQKKIEKQVQLLESTPDVGVAYCGRKMESGYEEYPDCEVRGDVLPHMLQLDAAPCLTSTLLIDADPLREIHPFPNYPAASDVPIKIELAQRVEFDFVDELLVVAGDAPQSMGTSWANIEFSWKALEDYENLYRAQPNRVKRAAVAHIYQKTGRRYLEDRLWSPRAILSFAKSIHYQPEPGVSDYGEFLASIGGAPGRNLGSRLASRW